MSSANWSVASRTLSSASSSESFETLPPCRLDPTEVIADVQSVTAEQTSFAQSSVADASDDPPSSPPQPAASPSARTETRSGDEGGDPHD